MSEAPITPGQEDNLEAVLAGAVKRARDEVGPDKEGLQRLFGRRREFDDTVVALIRRLTAKTPDYATARSILGGDFISPEEIAAIRSNVIYTEAEIAALASALPSEDVLHAFKEGGYGLMPQPPSALSLLDVRGLEPSLFYRGNGGWFEDQIFARENKTGSGWFAFKKTPVEGSTRKTWNEQNKLLSGLDRVPNCAEVSWFVTNFFKVRGVRLLENIYVRCSDLDSDGDRVVVGDFDAGGLGVRDYWDGGRGDGLGLAAARKF